MISPRIQLILRYVFAFLLISGGINHLVNPEYYAPLIPDFLPERLSNGGSGIVEILIGIGLLWKRFRAWSSLAFMVLMLIFLPLHVWDLFRDDPALIQVVHLINPDAHIEQEMPILVIRVLMQLLLIYGGWWLWRREGQE